MNTKIRVDSSKCNSCGTCVEECHRHLPVNRRTELESDGVECVGCLHCYAVCPQGAIAVEGLHSQLAFKENGGRASDETALLSLLTMRRSTRRFTEQSVHENMVERLIQAAVYIPSGGNSHSYRFTVITQGQQRKRLEQQLKTIYTFRRKLLKNPVLSKLFALVSDKKTRAFLLDDMYLKRVTYLLDQYERGEDPVFYGSPLIVIVHTDALVPTPGEDAILAAYNMVLMAQTMGLGSCFVSLAQNAINASRRCKKLLHLGSGEQVHAVVVLGYPDVSFHRAIPREAKQFEYIN